MSQLLDVLFGGGAESPLDRIIRQSGFTPGINPTASHPLTTLPGNNPSAGPVPMPNPLQTRLGAPESDMAALARQNNFGGNPVTSNVSDRRISATADRNTRGERGIEKILGSLGGPGRAVRDFISPATNALGTIMDVAEGAAAKGGLSSIAPNFSAGVQAAAQQEIDNASQRTLDELRKAQAASLTNAAPMTETFGKVNPSDFTPESLSKFQESGDFSDLELRSKNNQSSAAIAEFNFVQNLSPDEREEFLRLKRRMSLIDVPGIGYVNPESGQLWSSEEEIAKALAARKAEEKQQLGDVDRLRELPAEMDRDQQFVDNAKGFIQALKDGTLDTGFILGKFPAISTQGQLFEAFSGEKIIDQISQATFGALSKGEMDFLAKTAFGRGLDEKANIELLEETVSMIEGAMRRGAAELQRIRGNEADEFEGFSIVENNRN